ncbi:FixH family protein [Albibacterium bauzanense]|uniref:FixH protein n=1 Tax=Albibacterium bauzanense TaxID=653929 RepID=A0A4R1M769_9SPHI|nr:FixH family protein [Albibacterium bauzanense]TCK85669.1 hypothetical protein C8N28_0981 [Albibacterium bauzanense]
MNWGTKIFITLLIFMATAIGTGIYMVSQDQDTLIEDNYYEKGINYDSTYNQKTNVQELKAEPTISTKDNYLEITFTETGNKGILNLQRTSNSSLDQQIPFSTEDKVLKFSTDILSSGEWKIRINWEHNNNLFLFEKDIFIP